MLSSSKLIAAVALAAISVACDRDQPREATFSAKDESLVRALDSSYVVAWLKDDTTGVMATLAPDAVMMPAGQFPLTSPGAIRGFWWPADGSHTRILTFDRVIDEVQGVGDVAYVRGHDSLTYSYDKGSSHSRQSSRSMTLGVLRRAGDGSWRISRMMWGTRTK